MGTLDLSVEIAGIRMPNPVMNASGTLSILVPVVKELAQIEMHFYGDAD